MVTTTLAIAWLVHFVSWFAAMALVRRSGARPREWLPELILRLLMAAVVVWALVAGPGRVPFPGAVKVALLAVCVAGHAVAVIARHQLHRRWGIGTREPERAPEVVRHGLYRWIRHPIYAGTGAAIAFQAAILHNLPSLLMLAGAAVVIPWKMRREDRWIRRARGAVIAAFVVMPPSLMTPGNPQAVFVAAMRDGDAAFRAFDNETARLCYRRAFAIDSTDCDVLWKLARADLDLGVVAASEEKLRWLASGEKLARRCVALHPDSSEARFYLAVAVGMMSDHVGGKRRIALSKEVKREAEATLSIEPRHYGAMHVLGRWNYEVSSLSWLQKAAAKIIYGGVPPGASFEQAREWFERAISGRPELPLNHYWLGETLIRLGDRRRAREELQRCLELDDVFWDDHLTKDRARKALREIEGQD
jgi:protein-S-isoprenylcysteine O-methyltransferase Ste14